MRNATLWKRPAIGGYVSWEDPIPQLADRWVDLGGSGFCQTLHTKFARLARCDALASPAPIDASLETEGMAGVQRSPIHSESNWFRLWHWVGWSPSPYHVSWQCCWWVIGFCPTAPPFTVVTRAARTICVRVVLAIGLWSPLGDLLLRGSRWNLFGVLWAGKQRGPFGFGSSTGADTCRSRTRLSW